MLNPCMLHHLLLTTSAFAAPVRTPLPVTQEHPDNLTEQETAMAQALVAAVTETLTYYPSYTVELPPSLLTDDTPLIRESSLTGMSALPLQDALYAMAFSDDGKRKDLSTEQLTSIWQTGTFAVEDGEKQYQWSLNRGLQKGRENTISQREDDLTWAKDRLLDSPGRLFFDEPFSIRHGVKQIGWGLRDITSLIVGLPEYNYSKAEITSGDAAYIRAGLQDALHEVWAEILPQDDLRQGVDGMSREALSLRMAELEHEIAVDWNHNATEQWHTLWVQLASDALGEAAMRGRWEDTIRHHHREALFVAMEQDEPLEALHPGVGAQLASIGRAEVTREQGRRAWAQKRADTWETEESKMRADHPTRSDDWVTSQTAVRVDSIMAGITAEFWQTWIDKLDGIESSLLDAETKFWISTAPQVEQTLIEQWREESVEPARYFYTQKKRWTPTTRLVENEELGRYYELAEHSPTTIYSDKPFWRLHLLGSRSIAGSHNAIRWGFQDVAWNGYFGIRSLTGDLAGVHSFPVDHIATTSGEIAYDMDGRIIQTYGSRLKSVWTRVTVSRQRFEATPDDRFLPKNFKRVFHVAWNSGIRAPVETLFIGVGQPIMTVASVGVGSVSAVTSVAWSPAVSILRSSSNLVLWDGDSTHQFQGARYAPSFVSLPYQVVNLGIMGAGQTAGAAVWGVAGAPLLAGTAAGGAVLRVGVRTGYDGLLHGAVIRPLGRVPAQESFLAYPTEGPELSQHALVTITPELAVTMMMVRLEQRELVEFEAHHVQTIQAPGQEY
ncbi:MAG: hypothetical protein ACI8RZ_007583, partial [Myxococcota bacterium]